MKVTDHLPATIQADPLAMIAQAMQDGREINVDTMERLMAMRRELKAESAEAAYRDALADFQRDCPIIEKRKAIPKKNGGREIPVRPARPHCFASERDAG